jgi:NADH-ubiquinone oxidoreductase chain 5
LLDTEFAVPSLFKILPLILTLSLSFISIIFLEFAPKTLIYFNLSNIGYNIYGFFSQRFLIELFYNKYIIDFILKLGGQTTKVIDKGSIELIGPYGLERGLVALSINIANLDTGVITTYALYILVGLIFYILMLYSYMIDNNIIILIIFALLTIRKKSFFLIKKKPLLKTMNLR